MRSTSSLIGLSLAVLSIAGQAAAAPVLEGGRRFTTTLTGAAEVPGPGDPDGSGIAMITLNHGQRRVCYELSVSNIATPVGAHIHVGTSAVAGPIVIPLTPPVNGTSSGCVNNVDRALIKAIIQSPQNYYVNVHSPAPYQAGAVRGQLSKK